MGIEMAKLGFNRRCKSCNSLIIYDPTKREENGEYTKLDLNCKRHFCSDIDKIEHECKIIDHVKRIIDNINKMELTSFELELKIVD
jgi:hypothetical protein